MIRPIPKKNNPTSLTDLHPISILPFLSKILEKNIYSQTISYLDNFNILPKNQSGFRKQHSTTTVLVNVVDDIMRSIDKKEVTALVLLDFSKAFDTVNHQLLCAKLKYVGFDRTVNFFTSYFKK